MKTLTLKNKTEKITEKIVEIDKPTKRTNYKFKNFEITECGKRTIGICQSIFENFYNQLYKIDATKDEKDECLRHLKEACSWYSRGIAKFHKDREKNNEEEVK